MATFNTQKILTGDKTIVEFAYNNYSSMTFSNSHASTGITMDLYITSQVGTKITDTASQVNYAPSAGYPVTTSSQAIVIDYTVTASTSDMFLNEQVWKSDGNLIGTCTAWASATGITFGGGLVRALVDDDDLYTGTRYYILRNVKLGKGSAFKLTADEFNFDNTNYTMYINSDQTLGGIDIITRY